MGHKFDAASFNRLACELIEYKNDNAKKPNGILSACIEGLERILTKSPAAFVTETAPEHRRALKNAIQSSDGTVRIRSDHHLYTEGKRVKNQLRKLRSSTEDIDRSIAFAQCMSGELAG